MSPNTPPPVPESPRPFIPGFSGPKAGRQEPKYSRSPTHGTDNLTTAEKQALQNLIEGRESETLTLVQLVSKYSKLFPVQVRVVKGFYTDRAAIPADDIYNIHFLKRAKVVTVRDCYDDTYMIPYNSVVTFGVLYDEKEDIQVFEMGADLIDAPALPKIVIAQRSFDGKYSKTSVDKGEVLVLRGIHKPKFPLGHGKGTIDAFSITKAEEKTILANCAGSFSTNPYFTRLHLPEVWKYIPEPSQIKARMFWDCDDLDDLPTHLMSGVVSFCHCTTESSLISTLVSDPTNSDEEVMDDDDEASGLIVDIPLNLSIEVVVVPPPEAETDKLYNETREIYNAFHPSKVTVCVDLPMDEMVVAQSHLFSVVREGHENEGMDLQIPPLAYDGVIPSRRNEICEASDSDDEYEKVDLVPPRGRHTVKPPTFESPPSLPPPNLTRAHAATTSTATKLSPSNPPATKPKRPSPTCKPETANEPPPVPGRPKLPIPIAFQKPMSLPDHRQKSPTLNGHHDQESSHQSGGDSLGPMKQERPPRKPEIAKESSTPAPSKTTPPKVHAPKTFQKAMSLPVNGQSSSTPDRQHDQKPSHQSGGDNLSPMKQELERLASLVDGLSATCAELQQDVRRLKGEVAAMAGGRQSEQNGKEAGGHHLKQKEEEDEARVEENLQGLVALTQAEVCVCTCLTLHTL